MLTAFRSNTPSFASCNKVTNLVVSSPRLFSCLLGVCGCSESPAAPSSPLLLADSSSIITRDQLRTSPCLPHRTQPASPGMRSPAPQQPNQNTQQVCGHYLVFLASVGPGLLRLIWVNPTEQRQKQFNERAFAEEPLATRGMTGQFNLRRDRLQILAPIQKHVTILQIINKTLKYYINHTVPAYN